MPAPSSEVTKAENAFVATRSEVSLSTLSVKDEIRPPDREGYGTLGTPIMLRTNYFEVVLPDEEVPLFRYNVTVDPAKGPKRKLKRAFQIMLQQVDFLARLAPHVATDFSSMIITTQKLRNGDDFGPYDVEIPYFEPEDGTPSPNAPQYRFRITLDKTLSVQQLMQYLSSPQPQARYDDKDSILQVLNVIMARRPSSDSSIASTPGNKFFPAGGQVLGNLGGGLVALKGYYTSVRTSTLRLLLNVNSITGAFYLPGPLLNLMRVFKDALKGRPYEHALHKFLKGVQIQTTHLKTKNGEPREQKKVIAGLASVSGSLGANAKQATFDWDPARNGQTSRVTVEEYFKRRGYLLVFFFRIF